jgi:uncharacterized linocin/CFP29 family protein
MGVSKEQANLLLSHNMDVGVMRPYLESEGTNLKAYMDVLVNVKREWSEQEKGYVVTPEFDKVEIPVGNASLRKDEWIEFDAILVRESRERLRFVNLLNSRGLTKSVDGMSKFSLESENVNEFQPAALTMDGINRGPKDQVNYELAGIPLPIAHFEFDIPLRKLNASRQTGEALDTTSIELATRQVAELIEDIHLNGASSYKAANYTMYGVTDHPNVNTGSLTANWDDSAASGTVILGDVLSMLQAARADGFYGPFALLVPGNFEGALDEDFKANSDKTIRERLMDIDAISDILVLDKLSDDTVVLMQLTNDVMRTVNGLSMTTVQWDSVGGMGLNFKVMAIQVPNPRATQAGKSGIVVYT